MLFELTTGKRLFKGASEFETLKLICDNEYLIQNDQFPILTELILMSSATACQSSLAMSLRI